MPGPRPFAPLRRAAVFFVLACASSVGNVGSVAAAPDVEIQKKVNEAVERGAAWLLAQRGADGMYEPLIVKDHESYDIGVTCLCGLALLAAGESKKDPGMLKMLEAVRRADQKMASTGSRRTYDTGTLLMFLTEMYRPEAKPSTDRYAKAKVKDPCGLPKDLQALVQELANTLVAAQLSEGWWRYPQFPPGDLSNTQYALLGLRAARDCGATVSPDCFVRALDQTLAQQEPDGPKVRRIVKGSGKPGESDYAVDSGDRARGWKYQPDAGQVTGSMTTAGIAVVAICCDALAKPERYGAFDEARERSARRAVQDGFAWLDKHWAVDKNPPPGAAGWHYYYLYGLERACAFAGREAVGAHDWYWDGARYLVGQQKAAGKWSTGTLGAVEMAPSDLLDTAWALLFLKKATRPTLPVKEPVVTSGN